MPLCAIICGARPLVERAPAIREQMLGPNHPDTQTVRRNLEILIRQMGGKQGQ